MSTPALAAMPAHEKAPEAAATARGRESENPREEPNVPTTLRQSPHTSPLVFHLPLSPAEGRDAAAPFRGLCGFVIPAGEWAKPASPTAAGRERVACDRCTAAEAERAAAIAAFLLAANAAAAEHPCPAWCAGEHEGFELLRENPIAPFEADIHHKRVVGDVVVDCFDYYDAETGWSRTEPTLLVPDTFDGDAVELASDARALAASLTELADLLASPAQTPVTAATSRFGARGPSGRVWCPDRVDSAGRALTAADVAETIRTLVVEGGLDLVQSDDDGATWHPAGVDDLDAWAAATTDAGRDS